MEHFSAGGISSFVAAIVLQPLDVLKTRLQEEKHHGKTEKLKNFTRLYDVTAFIRRQYQKEGLISFWRGTGRSYYLCYFGLRFLFTE